MEKSDTMIHVHSSTGDTAVSGLFSGLQGGLVMAAVIVIFSLLAGQGLGYLGNFSSEVPVQPGVGLVMHLAVSSIYGMFYALGRRWARLERQARLSGWLTGLIYGLGLWAFAVLVLLPAAKSLILDLPWVVFFSGHIAYGLVLGLRQKP
jgi:hypothetical protein